MKKKSILEFLESKRYCTKYRNDSMRGNSYNYSGVQYLLTEDDYWSDRTADS